MTLETIWARGSLKGEIVVYTGGAPGDRTAFFRFARKLQAAAAAAGDDERRGRADESCATWLFLPLIRGNSTVFGGPSLQYPGRKRERRSQKGRGRRWPECLCMAGANKIPAILCLGQANYREGSQARGRKTSGQPIWQSVLTNGPG